MSTTANKEQSSIVVHHHKAQYGSQFGLSPSETPIDNLEASLDHFPATFPFAHPTENVLYDDFESLDILDWNNDVRADQTTLLLTEFNHANDPNWNYNPTGNIATAFLDPFMKFQNFPSFEPNTISSNDRYLQGFWDGIDAAINLHGQETDCFVSAPNTTTEQGLISGEVDINTALIGQQATPPAPLIGSFANHVAPAPRFACNFIGCGKTFGRQSDCNRHMKKHEAPEYSCPEPGCDREFYRRDKVKDHAQRIHRLQL